MSKARPNLLGERFGWLVVRERIEGPRNYWLCQCDCGNTVRIQASNLRSENQKSCGCFRRERLATHRAKGTPEHTAWTNIKARCYSPTRQDYARYGGRGITVCEEWRSDFLTFLRDMGPRPSPEHSIGRRDNDGNYEPGNCRWETRVEQGRNKRNNRIVEWRGQRVILADAIRSSRLPEKIVDNRLRRGWSLERALTEPLKGKQIS